MIKLKDIDRKKTRYNLEETWVLCMAMWRYVVRQRKHSWVAGGAIIDELKILWLRNNRFGKRVILYNCFFCEYQHQHGNAEYGFGVAGDCPNCPAYKIDNAFHCFNKEYEYGEYPERFLEKLETLYKMFRNKRKIR